MSEKSFEKLENHVTEEYEKKGYSKKEAEYIGRATAGEVATEKHRKARLKRKRKEKKGKKTERKYK